MGNSALARTARTLIAAGLVGASVVSIATPAAAAPSLEITAPTPGEVVDQGDYTVRGNVAGDEGSEAWIIFAVDVSGSTGASGFDCDGSGSVDAADDLNFDGVNGEILDCEIAGLISLNTSLATIPGSVDNINVGLVPFGSSAGIADVGGDAGQRDFVAPTDDLDDNPRDRLEDIVQAATSMNQGSITLFNPLSVGGGTNFNAALNTSFDALADKTGTRLVYLLTDGQGSLSESTLTRGQDLDIEVRPFAISSGSDRCRFGGALDRIAFASGTSCIYAPDPAGLTTAILGQPSTIEEVEVRLDGGAKVPTLVDPLGNFEAQVFLSSGDHSVEVVVRFADGTTTTETVDFRAESATRIVGLGDSYSAGEGIEPWVDLPGPAQGCHQSTRGYAALLGTSGFEIPGISGDDIALDFAACSGAILRNITAVPQSARGETHIIQGTRVDESSDLVVFTIGGNDVGFSEVMAHCATQFDCWKDGFAPLSSGRTLSADEYLLARVVTFLPQAGAFYETLRDDTDDNATIVALNYPELFDDGLALRAGCVEAAAFERREREWINDRTVLFRDLLQRATSQAGIWFVDVVDEFKGHRVCEGGINTQSEWLVGIEAALSFPGSASFHPDPDGQQAYARLISEFLNDKVDEGVPLNRAGLPLNPGAVQQVSTLRAAAAPLQQAPNPEPSADFPNITADTLPSVADLGLSESDVAELLTMSFGHADLSGLSVRRGDATCSNTAVLGQQLVVEGHGYIPGSNVDLFLKSDSEADRRTTPLSLIADSNGLVSTSIIVPFDLLDDQSGIVHATVTIGLEGTGLDLGGFRRLAESFVVEAPGGECTSYITDAGDVSPDGTTAAPSAASTPGVPSTVTPLPSLLGAGGCTVEVDVAGFSVIIGTPGDDVIVGTNGNDLILSGAGNDTIEAGNGNDIVCGGPGNDTINGNNGSDVVDGGSGDDYASGDNAVDEVRGSAGNDTLAGGNGKDVIDGGSGDDTGDGGRGNDTCRAVETTISCEA